MRGRGGAVEALRTGVTQADMDAAIADAITTALVTASAAAEPASVTEARTATVTGATTGTITVGTDIVIVTSDDANKIIVLPDAAIGTVIALINGATGYELRTHAPATVGINGGTGANAESAIPASMRVVAQRTSATNWVASNTAADGTVTVTEVAA